MRKLLLACAAVAMIACGGSDSTGPAASVEGTWNLQTVNGQPLPYTAFFNASPVYRIEILSDQVIAHSDGTYVENGVIRTTDGTTVTTTNQQDTGLWAQHGGQVDFTSDSDASVTTATVSGDQLHLSVDGFTGIYVRQ